MEKIKGFFKILVYIDEKLGFGKLIEYTTFFLLIYGIFNFSSIVRVAMDIQEKIAKEDHQRKLRLRDELMDELPPLLVELRSKAGADRVLYFEYHNSTENFVGIPFKFANLVAINQEYGASGFNQEKYKDINSGLLGSIYSDLKKRGIIINETEVRENSKYPEVYEFFSSQDGSNLHVFINIPGYDTPVGMIVLEWLEPEKANVNWEEFEDWVIRQYIPRLNHLIQSKAGESNSSK